MRQHPQLNLHVQQQQLPNNQSHELNNHLQSASDAKLEAQTHNKCWFHCNIEIVMNHNEMKDARLK